MKLVMRHLLLLLPLLLCCSADGSFCPSGAATALTCADSRRWPPDQCAAPSLLISPNIMLIMRGSNASCSVRNRGGGGGADGGAGGQYGEVHHQQPFNTAASTSTTAKSVPPPSAQPVNTSHPPPPPMRPEDDQQQDAAICLERLAAAHPGGSAGRAFLYSLDGKVWLVSSGAAGLQVVDGDGVILLLDLAAGRGALRLMGLALHPEFHANGRFFVSYAACDSNATSRACAGAGASSSSAPATAPPAAAAAASFSSAPAAAPPAAAAAACSSCRWPCRYHLVVEEFSAEGIDFDYGMGAQATPTPVRMIFTMGLPQLDAWSNNQQRGGQILFLPGDGYLYLITGHGGDEATSSSFRGKIIKLDVDGMAVHDGPEVFATGLSDPRGCSFDSERPTHMYCAGVDEQQNEQVYLITKDKELQATEAPTAKATVSVVIRHGRPTAGDAPSIVGGIVYRGPAEPSLNGRYLHMYNSSMWAAVVTPASNNSGLYEYPSARILNVKCSRSSPVPCGGVAIAGSIVSLLGQDDNSKDAFIIATGGIYRVIPHGICGGAPPPPHHPAPPREKAAATNPWLALAASILGTATAVGAIYFWWPLVFGGSTGEEQQAATTHYSLTCNCCFAWTCCFCGNRDDGTGARNGAQGGNAAEVELAMRV